MSLNYILRCTITSIISSIIELFIVVSSIAETSGKILVLNRLQLGFDRCPEYLLLFQIESVALLHVVDDNEWFVRGVPEYCPIVRHTGEVDIATSVVAKEFGIVVTLLFLHA